MSFEEMLIAHYLIESLGSESAHRILSILWAGQKCAREDEIELVKQFSALVKQELGDQYEVLFQMQRVLPDDSGQTRWTRCYPALS